MSIAEFILEHQRSPKLSYPMVKALERVGERWGQDNVQVVGFEFGSNPCLMVKVPGMVLGIEQDGYTHS